MIGDRLGPWILEKLLGRGGMGHVYRARRAADAPGEPDVAAVKVLAAELAVDPGFLERFRREIEILRRLDHPNIVHFLQSGAEDGHTWFAMEYVDGPSLEAVCDERGPLPWREVLELAEQIAPALKHAHDRGVVHRDLKPSNLLLGPDGVKLTDFGIASLFASRHLTVTGGVVGTAEYLSPEQAAGKAVTPRSDLYSLGVVLYTLVTGRTPFVGEAVDLLHKHRFAQFDHPSRQVPDIPGDFEELICELLEKDPGRRPHDAGTLARRLSALRRRLEYRAAQVTAEVRRGLSLAPADGGGEGPATLMSRLMRLELERQKYGGPVRQFFNRPWVVVTLFLLTVGTLIWTFWPSNPEHLYRRGAALMASENPDDWYTAWDKYLGPLKEKYPEYRRQEVAAFQRQYDETYQAARRAAIAARQAGPMSEPQWFYQEGLRLRQQGDEPGARRLWQAVVDSFGDVAPERPWVRLAQKELDAPKAEEPGKRQWKPVRDAVKRASDLRAQGKDKEADVILRGLHELYGNDPAAQAILKEGK
jgi:serine/threonine-protein kinase